MNEMNKNMEAMVDEELDTVSGGMTANYRAALDVMVPEPLPADHPLWSTPNLLITPHVSGNMSLPFTCDIDVELFCRDLARFAQGQPLSRVVDRRLGY